MGSLLQDVIGLFSKKKFVQPLPYTVNKDDYFVLSTRGSSELNVMAYLPKVEQELISTADFAAAISSGSNTTYDYTSVQNGNNVDLKLTGSDATVDIVKLIAGTNIVLADDGANQITISASDAQLGTVTSVDLTMPAAFTVAGNPITTAGTLAVTGSGTTLQYVDGTGALQTFPTIPSGTMSSWTLSDGTTTQTIEDGNLVLVVGTTKITTTVSAVDQLSIDHDDTARTDTTSAVSPGSGASFTVIDTITQDATGHPTAVNVKTVTLPTSTGTVTSVTSATTNQLTITNTTTTPELTVVTGAITGSANTFLSTAGQIYDWVISLGYVESVVGGVGINLTGTAADPVVNIDYAGVDNAILSAPTAVIDGADYIWYSDSTDQGVKKALVSSLPGGGGGVTQLTAGTNISLTPAGGTGVVQVNSTDQYVGTVTSVATSNGTFVNVTGGIITAAGTITAELSASGTPDNTKYLRGDNTWATVPSGSNTTYDLDVPAGTTNINLAGSDATNDPVTITGGSNITVTRTSATELTIAETSTYTSWIADSDEGTDITVGSGSTLMFTGAVTAGGAGIATDSAISAGEMTIGLINSGGTPSATTFYRGDGQWATPAGTGTVSSVGLTMPAAFTVANSPITSSGTLAVTGAGIAAQYVDGTGALQTFPNIPQGDITDILEGDGITVTNGGGPSATVEVDYVGVDNIIMVRPTATPENRDYVMWSDYDDDTVKQCIIGNMPGYYVPWELTGDTGSTLSIVSGQTVLVAGGTALSSVTSSTATVTLNLDNTAVTAGSYTYSSITVDQQGRLTAASSGTAPAVTSLTTTGTTGVATLSGGVLNIPDYGSGAGTTYQAGDGLTLDTGTSPDSFLIDYLGTDNYIYLRPNEVPIKDDWIAFHDITDNNVKKCSISSLFNSQGYTNWVQGADIGTDNTITSATTLDIVGGSAISTTNTSNVLTINHVNVGAGAATYTYPSAITVDLQGHVTAVTSGGGGGPEAWWSMTPGTLVNAGSTSALGTLTLTSAGTGIYTCTFTTAQSSTNYMVNICTEGTSGLTDKEITTYITDKSTTSFTVMANNSTGGRIDPLVNIVIWPAT